MGGYITSHALQERGFVVLDPYDQPADPAEWLELEYTAWRSSGVTRFAPLASFAGEVECNGFWNHTPPRTDKDGVWIPSQVEKAPHLTRRAQEPGANVGRCRVIELQPNEYADAVYNLHHDDNNRLNHEGTGWVVRGFFNLTEDADSVLILRDDRFDATTEMRIPLAAGSQVIVDTERFWHAVWHRGPAPRYSLITSWESGPELDAYIAQHHGHTDIDCAPVDPKVIHAAQHELHRRIEERRKAMESLGTIIEGPA
ncbi:hypothetical protein ASD65_11285 [Microbacterium sp. Root61]|uniref:hypothetical protein n=1 Tax=Microbacterium sp. Root61 TaxID=1736570 RepID=UPI0006FB6327|nr:hypothetical protein [Microbacterium sp. Root61]KRA24947.1 hypothetical protein ASD65_11285 [Microbacterium sp. Root61]